jgi:hypothetical protein
MFLTFSMGSSRQACGEIERLWCASKPGLAPAGDLLFFASPKKPKEKKGDPMVWVPPLRCGQPAVLGKSGVSLELAFGSDNRDP